MSKATSHSYIHSDTFPAHHPLNPNNDNTNLLIEKNQSVQDFNHPKPNVMNDPSVSSPPVIQETNQSNSPPIQLNFLKENIALSNVNNMHSKFKSSSHLTENKRYDQLDNNPQQPNTPPIIKAESSINLHHEPKEGDQVKNDVKVIVTVTKTGMGDLPFKNPFDSYETEEHDSINIDEVNTVNYEISPLKNAKETVQVLQDKRTSTVYNKVDTFSNDQYVQKTVISHNNYNQIQPQPVDEVNDFIIHYPTMADNCIDNNNNHNSLNTISEVNDMAEIKLQISDNRPSKIPIIDNSLNFSSTAKMNPRKIPDLVSAFKPLYPNESLELINKRKLSILNDNPYSLFPMIDTDPFPMQNSLGDNCYDIMKSPIELATEIKFQGQFEAKVKELLCEEGNSKAINGQCCNIGKATPLKRIREFLIRDSDSSMKNYTQALTELEDEVKVSRTILSDGDGFYRSFAFAMIENMIKLKGVNKLELLTEKIAKTDINHKKYTWGYEEVDRITITIILKAIVKHIKAGLLSKAYRIFINAFLNEISFEIGLIKYIRITLANYIELNKSLLKVDTLQKIISNEYLQKNINTFQCSKFINNEILCKKQEPDPISLSLISKALEINMNLYYIEQRKLFKTLFFGNDQTIDYKSSFINIIVFSSRYEVGYVDIDYFKDYDDYYVNKDYLPSPRLRVFSKNSPCDICKEETTEIILSAYPGMVMCQKCLTDSIKVTMQTLATFFIADDYKHKECKQYSIIIHI